jgi:hypothetical protein
VVGVAVALLSGCTNQQPKAPSNHNGAYLEFMKDEKNRKGISEQSQSWTEPQKRCFDKWYFNLFAPETQRNLDASVSGDEKLKLKSLENMEAQYDFIFKTDEGKRKMDAAKAECGISPTA